MNAIPAARAPGSDAPQALMFADSRKSRVRHLLLHRRADRRADWRAFLHAIVTGRPPTWRGEAGRDGPHAAFGVTWQGLQMEGDLLPHARRVVRGLAPAFTDGAPVRAAARLGDDGCSAATGWLPGFAAPSLLGVATLMDDDGARLARADGDLRTDAGRCGLRVEALPDGIHLGAPPGRPAGEQWVHFGLRDGISRLRFGSGPGEVALGELLLGEVRTAGDNPWKLVDAPPAVQHLFHRGSFGALRMVEQHVIAFEAWVNAAIARLKPQWPLGLDEPADWNAWLKSRLCGRWPDGSFSSGAAGTGPGAESPGLDAAGIACPYGSHVRRLNPGVASGGAAPVHERVRVLARRGRAYGPANWDGTPDPAGAPGEPRIERGLLGHFFCASLEDQFEHLLGQWADRVPLGLPDRGNAKDPLIGGHHDAATRLEIPLPGGRSLWLDGWQPFVRTRGTAYLFYPSALGLHTLTYDRDLVDPDALERRP